MESETRELPCFLEPHVLTEVESEEEESLFEEEPSLLSPAPAPVSMYSTRRPHSSLGRATSLLDTLTSPLPPVRRQRQRTLSTNAAIRKQRSYIDTARGEARFLFLSLIGSNFLQLIRYNQL